MRKFLVFMMTLALLGSCALTGYAAQRSVEISDATAVGDNDIIFLTVSLKGESVGDTMGITYTYDEKVLEAVTEQCEWLKDGILSDFNINGEQGVWAARTAADLSGDICVLAFRVRSGVKLTNTEVKCDIVIKNGSQTVAELQASGNISGSCTHTYGDWTENGNSGHSRVCTNCGVGQSQSHSWDDGVLSEDSRDPSINHLTYTCAVCGATKTEEVSVEIEPSIPVFTDPTEPEITEPEETLEEPYVPGVPDQDYPSNGNTGNGNGDSMPDSGNQSGNGSDGQSGSGSDNQSENISGGQSNSGGQSGSSDQTGGTGDSSENHDHESDGSGSQNTNQTESDEVVCTDPAHDHDRSSDSGSSGDEVDPAEKSRDTVATVIIVIAVIAAVAVIVVYERTKIDKAKKTKN